MPAAPAGLSLAARGTMDPETTMAPARRPSTLGFYIGAGGHALAWGVYFLLGVADDPAVPGWAALVLAFGGREAILAVFSLASMLPLYAGVQEHATGGRPRLARVLGLLCAAVAVALAVRWYGQGRTVLTVLAAMLALPGLMDLAPSPRASAEGLAD